MLLLKFSLAHVCIDNRRQTRQIWSQQRSGILRRRRRRRRRWRCIS